MEFWIRTKVLINSTYCGQRYITAFHAPDVSYFSGTSDCSFSQTMGAEFALYAEGNI